MITASISLSFSMKFKVHNMNKSQSHYFAADDEMTVLNIHKLHNVPRAINREGIPIYTSLTRTL